MKIELRLRKDGKLDERFGEARKIVDAHFEQAFYITMIVSIGVAVVFFIAGRVSSGS